MPFKMSNWLEGKLANHFLRGSAQTFNGTVYLGLFTAFNESNDGDSFTEVSTVGTGYARRPATFAAPAAGATTNSVTISFPMATTNWGALPYFGLFDALSGGNLVYWGIPQSVVSCNTGEQVEFLTGELSLSIGANPTLQLANDIINMTVRGVPRSSPASVFSALLTAFTSDSVYSECSDAPYARQATTFSAPTDGLVANTGDLIWPAVVTPYTVTHIALFDTVSGGTMLVRGPLPTPKAVAATQQFKFATGDLQTQFD